MSHPLMNAAAAAASAQLRQHLLAKPAWDHDDRCVARDHLRAALRDRISRRRSHSEDGPGSLPSAGVKHTVWTGFVSAPKRPKLRQHQQQQQPLATPTQPRSLVVIPTSADAEAAAEGGVPTAALFADPFLLPGGYVEAPYATLLPEPPISFPLMLPLPSLSTSPPPAPPPIVSVPVPLPAVMLQTSASSAFTQPSPRAAAPAASVSPSPPSQRNAGVLLPRAQKLLRAPPLYFAADGTGEPDRFGLSARGILSSAAGDVVTTPVMTAGLAGATPVVSSLSAAAVRSEPSAFRRPPLPSLTARFPLLPDELPPSPPPPSPPLPSDGGV